MILYNLTNCCRETVIFFFFCKSRGIKVASHSLLIFPTLPKKLCILPYNYYPFGVPLLYAAYSYFFFPGFLQRWWCCSVTHPCPSLCNSMDCSTPGFHVHRQLPELAQTHVHSVSDAIQPSHLLLSPSPPAFNLSQHQGLFQ